MRRFGWPFFPRLHSSEQEEATSRLQAEWFRKRLLLLFVHRELLLTGARPPSEGRYRESGFHEASYIHRVEALLLSRSYPRDHKLLFLYQRGWRRPSDSRHW